MKVGWSMNYSYLDCLAALGVGGAHPGGLKLTKERLAQEKLDESIKILDAGCGTGQTSAYLAKEYDCDITALDQNKVMVEKANERFLSEKIEVKAVEGSIEELPFADNSFDLVLSESVMLFTDIAKSISECKRVLKPRGKLLAMEMVVKDNVDEEELVRLKDFYQEAHFHAEKKWKQTFKKAGFKTVHTEKPEVQFDPNDVDTVPEYSLSESVDPTYFEIMQAHEEMLKSYNNVLSFCVFRCTK
jgi:SAM-dependent methyltransferase